MNCSNCRQILESKLSDMPESWRSVVIETVCNMIEETDYTQCENNETVTKLSSFTRNNNHITVVYTDELGKDVTSSFDFSNLIDYTLGETNPKCLMTQDEWNGLDYVQKWEAILQYRCDCCKN